MTMHALLAVVFGFSAIVALVGLQRFRLLTRAAQARPMPTAAGGPSGIRMAADGVRWWNGARWVPSETAAPPGALWSPDGNQWYDGLDWHAIPAGRP